MDVCAHVCVVACAYVWRSEVDAGCLFSVVLHFVFETGCLIGQGPHWFVWTGWPANPSAGWVVSNHCQYRLEIQTWVLTLVSSTALSCAPFDASHIPPQMLCAVWGYWFACSFYQSGSARTFFFFVPFLSLGIIILGFIHIEIYSYFIVSNRWEPCDYTTICWIHLSMTYLGCLQAWVIGCRAALNFHGHSFVRTCTSVFWHRQLGAEWLPHGVSVFSSQLVYE